MSQKPFCASLFLSLLSFISVWSLVYAESGEKIWCVAKAAADESALQANKDYACSYVDCNKYINPGQSCFYPDNIVNHASVAMNLYYQAKGRNLWNCDFKNSGLITASDPSYGRCKYV